jgi:hypothetical protein
MLDLDRLAAASRRVLKDEPDTTVEVLGDGAAAVVRKVYRNRGTRWLQSFGRRCRARREFDNLTAMAAAGVPCTPPLAWSERRRGGLVAASTLVTGFVAGTATLKQVLRTLADRRDPGSARTRAALATAMGRLCRHLHLAGIAWGTPMPRNALVVGDPSAARLVVCDTPAALVLGRSLLGTELALHDLFDGAFSPSRRRDWSAVERLRLLRAYAAADRDLVRRCWRTLARRPRWRHDLGRALAMLRFSYLRRTPPPRPTPS